MSEPNQSAVRSSVLAPALPGAEIPFVALFAAGQGWLHLAAQWNSELLRFAAQRWSKDLETLVQLASCGSAAEILCVQSQVAADTASDYLGEAHQLLTSWNTALLPRTPATPPTGDA